MIHLPIRRVHPDATLPTYATEGSAGLDLYCLDRVLLQEGSVDRLRTGIAIQIPLGYEGQIRPRSSSARRGIDVILGTVDQDYRGEIVIQATAIWGAAHVQAGDRIAQLVIAPVARALVAEVEALADSGRGSDGFGSSGR